jgi:hypothetical protein
MTAVKEAQLVCIDLSETSVLYETEISPRGVGIEVMSGRGPLGIMVHEAVGWYDGRFLTCRIVTESGTTHDSTSIEEIASEHDG